MSLIDEAIQDIDEELKELTERRNFLQSLDTSKVLTEDEWHEICLSPLRSTPILGEFVQNIFPMAENITVGCNYVRFDISGIKCMLPTSMCRGIELDLPNMSKPSQPDEYGILRPVALKKYEKFISVDDWYHKVSVYMPGYHKIYKFFGWVFKYRTKKCQNQLKNDYDKAKEHYDTVTYKNQVDNYTKQIQERIDICNKLQYIVIPILSRFTDNITINKTDLFVSYNLTDIIDMYLNRKDDE